MVEAQGTLFPCACCVEVASQVRGAGDTLPLCRPRGRGEEGWVGVRSTRALVHRPYLAVGVRRQPHSGCRTSSITRVVSVRARLSSFSHALCVPLTRVAFSLLPFPPPSTFFPYSGATGDVGGG